jgi:hypothetical protein
MLIPHDISNKESYVVWYNNQEDITEWGCITDIEKTNKSKVLLTTRFLTTGYTEIAHKESDMR